LLLQERPRIVDKHYGMYRAIVTNNADPENRYRVKLMVPQLLGQEETNWAWPCVPVNWFSSGPTGPLNGSVFIKTPSHSDHVHAGHIHTVTTTGGDPQGGSVSSTGTAATGGAHTFVHDHNHDKFVLQDSVPRVGQSIWITFEGGDIDHPIWMGVWA
jgi:hypothetical protein